MSLDDLTFSEAPKWGREEDKGTGDIWMHGKDLSADSGRNNRCFMHEVPEQSDWAVAQSP